MRECGVLVMYDVWLCVCLFVFVVLSELLLCVLCAAAGVVYVVLLCVLLCLDYCLVCVSMMFL